VRKRNGSWFTFMLLVRGMLFGLDAPREHSLLDSSLGWFFVRAQHTHGSDALYSEKYVIPRKHISEQRQSIFGGMHAKFSYYDTGAGDYVVEARKKACQKKESSSRLSTLSKSVDDIWYM
jgi:hypothetical protein